MFQNLFHVADSIITANVHSEWFFKMKYTISADVEASDNRKIENERVKDVRKGWDGSVASPITMDLDRQTLENGEDRRPGMLPRIHKGYKSALTMTEANEERKQHQHFPSKPSGQGPLHLSIFRWIYCRLYQCHLNIVLTLFWCI